MNPFEQRVQGDISQWIHPVGTKVVPMIFLFTVVFVLLDQEIDNSYGGSACSHSHRRMAGLCCRAYGRRCVYSGSECAV